MVCPSETDEEEEEEEEGQEEEEEDEEKEETAAHTRGRPRSHAKPEGTSSRLCRLFHFSGWCSCRTECRRCRCPHRPKVPGANSAPPSFKVGRYGTVRWSTCRLLLLLLLLRAAPAAVRLISSCQARWLPLRVGDNNLELPGSRCFGRRDAVTPPATVLSTGGLVLVPLPRPGFLALPCDWSPIGKLTYEPNLNYTRLDAVAASHQCTLYKLHVPMHCVCKSYSCRRRYRARGNLPIDIT